MAESANDDAGERLGTMVVEWAESYWEGLERKGEASGGELRDAVTQAFMAGALTVFQRWDEVRPLVPRRRIPWRDLPSHHG